MIDAIQYIADKKDIMEKVTEILAIYDDILFKQSEFKLADGKF
jgi:hypothetical protein